MREMKEKGVVPDVVALNAAVDAFVRYESSNSSNNSNTTNTDPVWMLELSCSSAPLVLACVAGTLHVPTRRDVRLSNHPHLMSPAPLCSFSRTCHGRCGELPKARKILTSMEESPGGSLAQTLTYNTLIKGLGRELRVEEAFEVARGMLDRGCFPSEVPRPPPPYPSHHR